MAKRQEDQCEHPRKRTCEPFSKLLGSYNDYHFKKEQRSLKEQVVIFLNRKFMFLNTEIPRTVKRLGWF